MKRRRSDVAGVSKSAILLVVTWAIAISNGWADEPKTHSLKIRVTVDGTDEFRIFQDHAEWNHRAASPPAAILFNDVPWPDIGKRLVNQGTTQYLKIDKITPSAKLKKIKGRGRVEFITTAPGQWYVSIDDPQGGADVYELEISWGEAANGPRLLVGPIEAYGMQSPISLATYAAVQEEVRMTDQQIAKIQTLRVEAWNAYEKMLLTPDEVRDPQPADDAAKKKAKVTAAVMKITEMFKPKLAEFLDASQIERIDQIAIIVAAEQAYLYPTVIAALALTAEQQEKITSIHKQFSEKMRAMGGLSGSGGNIYEKIAKANGFHAVRLKDLDAVLSDDQRKKFNEMKGEPFDSTSLFRKKNR